jgi:hypothetical protein
MSIISLVLVYKILYAPFLDRLNKQTKAVRSLLLLFPDELSMNLGSLKDLLLNHGKATYNSDAKAAPK